MQQVCTAVLAVLFYAVEQGKDDVTECVWDYEQHRVVVRQSYNVEDAKRNEIISPVSGPHVFLMQRFHVCGSVVRAHLAVPALLCFQPNWGLVGWEAYRSDGRIRCRFERTKDVLSKKKKFDLGRSYHFAGDEGSSQHIWWVYYHFSFCRCKILFYGVYYSKF